VGDDGWADSARKLTGIMAQAEGLTDAQTWTAVTDKWRTSHWNKNGIDYHDLFEPSKFQLRQDNRRQTNYSQRIYRPVIDTFREG
jgi:hypothetical protein